MERDFSETFLKSGKAQAEEINKMDYTKSASNGGDTNGTALRSELHLMNIPAEIRCMIYEWVFILEDAEATLIPGKCASGVRKAHLHRYSSFPRRVLLFHLHESRARPIAAQTLPIFSVCRLARLEAVSCLFAKPLIFPHLYDIGTRIPRIFTSLPPLFRASIRKVSIEIRCSIDFGNDYGSFAIPYLSLCQGLKEIELRFSLNFYRRIFETAEEEGDNYLIFTKLVKLLICLRNIPVENLKVTIGNAYSHGGGLPLNRVTASDEESEVESQRDTDPSAPAKVLLERKKLKEKKARFDKTYANIFVQAAKHRKRILELPTVKKRLSRSQQSCQFYEATLEEKMAQMIMELEANLHFANPISPDWAKISKLSVEELLLQKAEGIYEEWLMQKYNIPKDHLELRLAELKLECKAMGYEDQMLLSLRPS